MKKIHLLKFGICTLNVVILLFLLTGCGLNFTVKDPVQSNMAYISQNTAPTVLYIVDNRTGMDSNFLLGRSLKLDNIQNPVAFFATHLEKELNSRQVPVKCILSNNEAKGMKLIVHRYQIVNVRATGYSPWESMHIFSGTLVNDGKKTAIKSYFYNGKVPMWSMNEVLEPCFNIPISIVIKDVASKIDRAAFELKASDQKVKSLTADLDTQMAQKDYSEFWKVLELGYTNNPEAINPLKKFARTDDEFFKSCAISSIGILGGVKEIEFLKTSYKEGSHNDRYMSVKALGDIAIPEAIQALEEIKKDPAYEKEAGLKYGVDLYLQR